MYGFKLTISCLGDILSALKGLNKVLQDPSISPQRAAYATDTKLADYLGKSIHWEARMSEAVTVLKPSSGLLKTVEKLYF